MTPAHLGHEGQAVAGDGLDVAGDAFLAQSASGADAGVVEARRSTNRRVAAILLGATRTKRFALLRLARARPLARTDGARLLGTHTLNVFI